MLRLLICWLLLPFFAFAKPKQANNKAVSDSFRALALDKQKLTGVLGRRLRANSEGFLENIDIAEMLRYREAEGSSAETNERDLPGLFLDAAADAFEYNHDLQLRAQMEKVAEAIPLFTRPAALSSNARSSEATLLEARSNLLGLLAYHRATGQPGALVNAQAIASSLIRLLNSHQDQEAPSGQSWALAQAGLIEPLVQLYRKCGERKYLEFSTRIARAAPIPEITSATSQAELFTIFSALDGLAELYEASGDAGFLQPVTAAWKKLVVSKRISVLGSPSPPDREAGDIDTCTAAAWLQLSFKLLRITGEPTYGDQLERSVYNQILASQDVRNGNISPKLPVDGSRLFSNKVLSQSGSCMLHEAKALALIPQLVWGRYENGIDINLYNPGRAFFTLPKHGQVQIYSESDFPQTGQLQLHIEPSKKTAKFPLRLRVPSWTDKFNVEVADLRLQGHPGEVVSIDREWRSGDTVRVSMTLPLSTPFTMVQQAGALSIQLFILQRGPQVLTLGQDLNPEIQSFDAVSIRPLPSGRFQISNYDGPLLPRNFSGDQVYRIAGQIREKSQDLLLIPFADATNYRTVLVASPDNSRTK